MLKTESKNSSRPSIQGLLTVFLLAICMLHCSNMGYALDGPESGTQPSATRIFSFGEAGKLKMLYDCRQRPQAVLLQGKVFIVYNGESKPTENLKGKALPMLISYDRQTREFSKAMPLHDRASSDHHFSPIIWADEKDHLHVLHGCHKTPGVHLVSQAPVTAATQSIDWKVAATLASKLSYPTVYRVLGNQELVYYRTDGHTSSWTYRLSRDNGRSWHGPDQDVTDLDSQGRLDWSSYQTKLPSHDGKSLHVVYTDYDDNKHDPDPQRFYNPRYQELVDNEWKYNLSYVKIDLASGNVFNAAGEKLKTPIDIDYSKEHCQIWNTKWRGAGIPPAMLIDENDEPSFLHVLSEANPQLTTRTKFH
ncbi:MAG: BNR-4 repeat-containing protein [Planctomycetota bacterium]